MKELVEQRRELGHTQSFLARLIGTSASNISAYEHGSLQPGPRVRPALEAYRSLTSRSAYASQPLGTVPWLAAQIRKDVVNGSEPSEWGVRLAAQLRTDADLIDGQRDCDLLLSRPTTTGDARWDALVAGIAEMIALGKGIPVGDWARRLPPLQPMWQPSGVEGFFAYNLTHAPMPLKIRGVLVEYDSLVSV